MSAPPRSTPLKALTEAGHQLTVVRCDEHVSIALELMSPGSGMHRCEPRTRPLGHRPSAPCGTRMPGGVPSKETSPKWPPTPKAEPEPQENRPPAIPPARKHCIASGFGRGRPSAGPRRLRLPMAIPAARAGPIIIWLPSNLSTSSPSCRSANEPFRAFPPSRSSGCGRSCPGPIRP